MIPAGKVIKGDKLFVEVAQAGDKAADASKAAKAVNKACQCFTAGTKVKTDQGEKNIEDVKIGDNVLSKDENTDEVTYKQVTATFNHETDEIYSIHVGDQVIESTYNHPFWVIGKGWVFVKDLKPGDLLEQSDGKTLEVGTIEVQQRQTTVYNMTVEGFHTYFVSGLGIWVHNDNRCKVLSGNNNVPASIREQYEDIKLGGGHPIMGRDGKQKVFQANELKNNSGGSRNVWEGALEYSVPGKEHHRILKRKDGKLGYVKGHDYSKPKLFPGPFYPEGGK